MMTSSQIAQANHHAFSMGFGANAGTGGYESLTGFTPFGHGAGSQFGTSALTGANSMVGTAGMVGMGSYFASLGINKLFGATRLGSALHGVGAATGMTLPMAATFGAMMPAQLALSGMASGAQQVAQTQNTLDNNFGTRLNMGGRFGFGVSRQDALNMTEAIRSLKSVPEMMTSMGELQSVLGKVSSMGILQGVQSASEFKTKFTSMVGALREISKNLGSTLEETLPFLQSSIRQGFLDTDEIRRNVQQSASATSVGIGMNRQRMFGLQEQGANMIRQMGGDSRIGSMGARDVASSISVAQSMGVLSQQDVLRLTGKTGEAGVADLSSRFMSAQAKLFQQRGAGRFVTAALAERDDEGNFTGRLNEEMLRKLRNNQIGGAELMRMGHKNLSGMSDEQALSFQNAMARGMGAEAGALAGMSGGATAMNAILEEMGANNDQAKRRILQSITGMNQAETDAMLRLAKNAANVQSRRNSEMVQAAVRDRSVAFFKENMTVSGAMHHATTAARRTFIDPFSRYGAAASTRISERFDDVMDDFITGSFGQKANMLLNPLEIVGNAGQVLFGQSKYRSSAARRRDSFGALLRGGRKGMGDMGALDITGGLQERGLSGLEVSGVAGTAGLTGALMMVGGSMLNPLIAGGAIASVLSDAYSGYDKDEMRNIFGNARTGDSLSALMNNRVSQREARSASDKLMAALRSKGISAGNLGNASLTEMLDIAESLGGEGSSGLGLISSAAQSDSIEGELASELRDRISSGLLARAIQGEGAIGSVGEANKRMEDIFDPGGFDNFVGGIVGHEAFGGEQSGYFASATAKSIMEGGAEGRSSLIEILKNKRLRGSLSNFSGNRGLLEKLMKREGIKGISLDDLVGLSRDLKTAYSEDGDLTQMGGYTTDYYLDIVAKDLESADKVLQAEDARQTRQSMMQTFTQGFSDKTLGKNIFDAAVTGGGLLQNVDQISGMLEGDVKGRVAKSIKSAMGRNNLTGVKTQSGAVDKLMKALGVSKEQVMAAGIFDSDDALSDAERDKASRILGFSEVVSAELDSGSSREARRAAKMGMDVESIRDKAFKESLEAQATTLRAHTDFVRTVGDVVPSLRRAAENTELVNAGGSQ